MVDGTGWQIWWEFNKSEFLQLGSTAFLVPTTGSDDYYLGCGPRQQRVETLLPSDADRRDRIAPALLELLANERNRDVQSACLVALGKVALAPKGTDLDAALLGALARDDQEVRESAVLALGISASAGALAPLLALVRDDAAGRQLVGRESVGDRTRAFAAYAAGLWARATAELDGKQAVHDALWAVLRNPAQRHRELRAAAVTGLGLLVADPTGPTHKRLAWQTVDELLSWYQQDLGPGDAAVQAHAPVAIGRLLGRGNSSAHQRCKQHFLEALLATTRRSNPIQQSAALALGMLALPLEREPADALASKALQQHYERGVDQLARSLSAIALGRIGGASNREWLRKNYARANQWTERPWLALALGLEAAAANARGERDGSVARLLQAELIDAPRGEVRGAHALALGMTGQVAAVPLLQQLLRDAEHDEVLAGYYALALAMLGDPAAAPQLTAILTRSQRRPTLLLQVAVALGHLGDRDATDHLVGMLDRSESVAVLAALAAAIGQIGDQRAIEPLLTRLRDGSAPKLARAFTAAALGGVGDTQPLPWNWPLSRDCNFATGIDTLSNGQTGVLDIL
jgi:hypothetical protein